MAKKKEGPMGNLNAITKFTNLKTYGISRNIPSILTNDVEDFEAKLNSDKEKNKSLINSHVSRTKLSAANAEKITNLYDIINSKEISAVIEGAIGSENMRFAQMLKDYEIIKRCIPQVHRVVNMIKNNIISPDSMGTDNILSVKLPPSANDTDEEKIKDLIEKYEVNQKIQNDIVMDYLIASVKYVTVVPYSAIPEMLYRDPDKPNEIKTVNECAELLDDFNNELAKKIRPLSESAGDESLLESVSLLESIGYNYDDSIEKSDMCSFINEQLSNIEFVDGAMAHYKDAIMNEAVNILSSDDKELRSMKNIIKQTQKNSNKIHDYMNGDDGAAEGLIDTKTYKSIKNKVDFKGAHIEYLPAARTIAFKMRDTIVGYFYVEDKIDPKRNGTTMSIMDKINSSVYIKNSSDGKAQKVEQALIRTISEKLIKSINPKFINDNYDDINIIYEFVKANEIHIKSKRVVFFHPDDVCEFRRSDGSIMKNCMFYAKLFILNMLSNVITKVMRGSDRQIHKVKTGLTTDVEGAVNDTIRAIKQNQIRYSDIGTINDIFNVVGSNVDVFMPISIDGEEPIQTETISGQQVDMNDDFTNTMIRSIIQSFNYPAAVVDDFESVEFAKTISMANLDTAKMTYDAQLELNPVLTKFIRLLVQYEYPDFEDIDEIKVQLNPPVAITYELSREMIQSVEEIANTISELMIPAEGETIEQKRKRMFKLAYYKHSVPILEWSKFEEIYQKVMNDAQIQAKEEEIMNDNLNNDDQY